MNSTRLACFPRSMACLCGFILTVSAGWAQQMSGSITGTVKDNQGALIPRAQVILIDQEHAGQRKMASNSEGRFTFDLLVPSTYTVSVEASGFKRWEQRDLKLYANDRLSINDIVMQVGAVTETITVEASAAQLQTESAKIEGTVTSQQFAEISVRDRNFMYLLKTIPGVTPDTIGTRAVNINGARIDQVSFKLDGLVNNDYGDNGCCSVTPSMDTIAEMKVITNGATADLGTLGASQVMLVTKSGGKELHGSAYYYKRAEWLNANTWQNNYQKVARARDRQNQIGFTLGGPVYIPKLFTKKDKLFFFVNDELWKQTTPSITRIWVPSAAERQGDFSQALFASDNSVVNPLDPLNRNASGVAQPFPDKKIPASRFSADGLALMKMYPLPNTDRNFNSFNQAYNYLRVNSPQYTDRLMQSYRLDYNLSDKWRIYGRYTHDYNEIGDGVGLANFELDSTGKSMGWNLQYRPTYSGMINITTIINPTMTNELVMGTTSSKDHHYIDKGVYLRKNLGLSFQLPYPNAVMGDYGPRVTYTGNGNGAMPSLGTQLPYIAFSPDYNMSDNLTKILTRHTLKAGIFFDWNRKDQDPWGGQAYAGNIQIGRDVTNNPYDTDYQFANLLTGTFNQFQQVPRRVEGRYFWKQFEWYVADTWKAKSNLTIDVGVRFYVMQPQYESRGQIAVFLPSLWDPSKAVRLYTKALKNGKTVYIDPANPSVTVPSYMYGAIVPGSGDINNGFALAGTNGIPKGMMPFQGVVGAPRLGVAWQPKFLPKTVIRASTGVFYDRIQGNVVFNSIGLPPTTRTQTLYYGLVSDISNAKSTLMSPVQVSGGYTGSGKVPTTVTWNLAIQRELPRGITFEVAYVGQASSHLILGQPLNSPAFGAAWLPQNQDPTVTPQYNGKTTLQANLWRPYVGLGNYVEYQSAGSSNYNSLQVQINKRMSRKLSFSVAYTYSKAMGIGDNIWVNMFPYDHNYNYGRLSFDRTHIFYSTAIYNLPKFGRNGNFLDHPGIRLLLNDWELTGTIADRSGGPTGFGFNFSSGVSSQNLEYTGVPDYGPRPYVVGDWTLPGGKRTAYSNVNVNAVQPARVPSVGRESGFNYWSNPKQFLSSPELTLMKNVPFTKDGRRYVQFRLETYNLLNHHDFVTYNMTATFASPTNLTLNNLPTSIANAQGLSRNGGEFGFGAKQNGFDPRRMQMSLRIVF